MSHQFPLIPKVRGGPLRVLMVGRISTDKQDLESIDAGHRDARIHLDGMYSGPLHVKQLGDRGSGLRTDRESIVEAEEEVATGTWDVVIAPDLGRIYRNPRHLLAFVQDAVDQDTRVIAFGDHFDTAEPDWEMRMGIAAIQHGMTIPDTRRRVKSKARYEFHEGGMVQKIRYGYRKLTREEAAAGGGPPGLRLALVPGCTPIIRGMRRRVMAGETYEAVAAWLIEEEVEPGPYVEGGWTGRLVAELLRDPILSGTRTFGDWLSTTLQKSGKPRRRKNPEGPEVEHYAELAHLTPAEQAELVAFMDERAGPGRATAGPEHPLFNKPRSRALWPAQHPRCGACGELMYRYEADDLKCRGCFVAAKPAGGGPKPGPRCWNHVQVDCGEVRARVLRAVVAHCEAVPGFRDALVDAAWSELEVEARRAGRSGRADEEEIVELMSRSQRLAKAIGRGGEMDALLGELAEINAQLAAARGRVAAREAAASGPRLSSRADVASRLEEALSTLSSSSYEFGDLMRRVLPEFRIVPVQALDSGLVRARGKLVLRLAALLGGDEVPGVAGDVTAPRAGDVSLSIDLFEPAAHIRAIGPCVRKKAELAKPSLVRIADATGINRMTVRRALAYAKLMESEGLSDPYRELQDRPASASRWRDREAS